MREKPLVYLVDDSATIRALAEHIPRYEVRAFPDLEAMGRETEPDALVLDLSLPGRDAFEALRARELPRVPLVLISGRHSRLLPLAILVAQHYGYRALTLEKSPELAGAIARALNSLLE
jgi:CheY-like chemotaxis protein